MLYALQSFQFVILAELNPMASKDKIHIQAYIYRSPLQLQSNPGESALSWTNICLRNPYPTSFPMVNKWRIIALHRHCQRGEVHTNDRVFPATVCNTLRPRQNCRHFPDNIFKWTSLNENVLILIMISLKSVPKGPINNIPVLVQIMAWRQPGYKPLFETMMVN